MADKMKSVTPKNNHIRKDGAAIAFDGKGWPTLCQRVAMLARSGYSVRVQLHGLDGVYPTMKAECENLLRVLRAAGESGDDFRAEAVIGTAKWRI